MKLNHATFREKLKTLLMDAATDAPDGSGRQQSLLLGASLLEDGKPCPAWIAEWYVPRAFQDAYGILGAELSRQEMEEIFDSCISGRSK